MNWDPVGLIDNHDLHARQEKLAPLEMVEQASRRGDQHIDAAIELLHLVFKRHAADQKRPGQLLAGGVFIEGGGDLIG